MSQVHADFVTAPTILVVDDNPDMVDLLTRYLKRQGMRVLPAFNGQQCLDQVRHNAVDVIVLDVMMPGMNGLEVCTALKAMPASRSTPVILLTAKDDIETRLAGIRLGVSEFLTKPVRGKDLLACIRTQIEVGRWLGELEQELESLSRSGIDPRNETQL
jgi:DNA-binding response OmpR family regulator